MCRGGRPWPFRLRRRFCRRGRISDAKAASYKIGVLQLTEHPALDAANKGFVEAIEAADINAKINQQNAQNDQSACQTIASTLAMRIAI